VIDILYEDDTPGSKGLSGRAVLRAGQVSTEALASSLRDLCAQVGAVFGETRRTVEGLELEGMDVTVEVTGSGEVRLVGAVRAEVSGGITLRFRARPTTPA
jgi:hypothetical protein